MNSKSVLLLGIVFIFLLNVVAVHDYINNSYYNSYKSNKIVSKKVINHTKIVKIKKQTPKIEKNKQEDITLYKSLYLSSTKDEEKYTQKLLSKQKLKIKKELKAKKKIVKVAKNIIIKLELNINNSYEKENPIIKKIAKGFNKNRSIVIKIYQFNTNIKKYIKNIKDDLVSNEIDSDDIKVIYNKTEIQNKNKIKILLIKKD